MGKILLPCRFTQLHFKMKKKAEKTLYRREWLKNCTSYSSNSGLIHRICKWLQKLQKLSYQMTKTGNQQIDK